MNSDRLRGFLQITRPLNVAISFVAIPTMAAIAAGRLTDWTEAIIAGMTGALATSGANAINDFFDVDIDRLNRPDRPIPRGALTKRDAAMVWLVTTIVAILLNLLLSLPALLIVLGSLALMFVYSAALKRTALAGNLTVAVMVGMAFIYGATVAGDVVRGLVPAAFAFLLVLAREIIKDVEDIEGDRAHGARTYPIIRGARPALAIASGVLASLILTTVVAHFSGLYSGWFIIAVSPVDAIVAYTVFTVWNDHSPAAMRRHSNRLKLCMILGLAAIIAGSL